MFTMLKMVLIGTCLLGVGGAQLAKPQMMMNNVKQIQVVKQTTTTNYIGEDAAKQIALQDAGVKEKDTTYLTVHLDHDDGVMVYEVEFMVGNKEYDYDIDAISGKILSKDFDIEGNNATSTAKGAVNEEQAKEIAVKAAGLTAKDVTFTKVKKEFDDGYNKIKVEFVHNGIEYEYDIDAATGKIIKADTDSTIDHDDHDDGYDDNDFDDGYDD